MHAFLAAVLAEPDDDLPRLIFADYLDERGDPRGAFIRTQIELTRADPDDLRRDGLLAAEKALQDEHEDAWLGPLGDELVRWWFHRGFIEVSFDVRRFLDGDVTFLDWPLVAGVHLYPPPYMDPDLVARLAHEPRANRVRSLYLGFEWVRDAVAVALAGSPHLRHLTGLDLGNNGVGDDGVVALAESDRLPALRVLGLSNNLVGDRGAAALGIAAHRSALRQLDLSDNEITSAGAVGLAGPGLAHLQRLLVAGNRFDGRSRGGRALRKRFGDAVSWRS